MANYWIKLYHEIVYDPKMARLSSQLWRRVIECFLFAGELDEDGFLPDLDDMAWTVQTSAELLEAELNELANLGIVDRRDGRWFVVRFAERQAPSPAAERMREYRKRKRKEAKEKEKITDKDTEADTDTYRTVTPVTQPLRNVTQKLPDLPIHLATADMLNEWGEWCQYHQDRGKPICKGTALLQFGDFNEWGAERSIAAMRYSRKNNYTGLIEPKSDGQQVIALDQIEEVLRHEGLD